MDVTEAGDECRADFIEFDVAFGIANFLEPRRKLQQVHLERVALPFIGGILFGVERGELLKID